MRVEVQNPRWMMDTTGAWVSFQVPSPVEARGICESLTQGEKYTAEIKKLSKKRSLDANSYYWLLVGKLSKAIGISMPHCHNIMLRRYGTFKLFGGQVMYVVLPDTDEASRDADEEEECHIKPTSQVKEGKDGLMYRTYIMLKGSHEYNTAEFRYLVEKTIEECKQVGIETATPDEVAKMISLLRTRGEK